MIDRILKMLFFNSDDLLYHVIYKAIKVYNAIKFQLNWLMLVIFLSGSSVCFVLSSSNISNSSDELTVSSQTKKSFLSSIEQRLISFVHKTVATVRYTAYKLGGSHFDTLHGIYILDCSTYIDNILEAIHPNAYTSLMNSSGSEKPTTKEYYNFF